MHADAAVTGLSRTPSTAARNTVQPLADCVNVTLKSKSGQTANHIEGRSFANVLQWSISAAGAALFASMQSATALVTGLATLGSATVTGLALLGSLQVTGSAILFSGASLDGDLVFADDLVIRRTIANATMEITAGTAAATGANLKLWGNSGSSGPDFALRNDSANIIFWDSSANTLTVTPPSLFTDLAGSGTRYVTASSSGLLGTTTAPAAGLVSGSGTANRVAYWSASDTITSSGNLTFNGSTMVLTGTLTLTGAQTVSSTLGVTGVTTLSNLAGTGTRLVQASSTGVLSATTAAAFGLVSGTGTTNNVSMWTSTTGIGDAPSLTWTATDGGFYTFGNAGGVTVTGLLAGTDGSFSGGFTISGLAGTGSRVVTASAAGVLAANANLTFDGSLLTVTGSVLVGTGTSNPSGETYDITIGAGSSGNVVASLTSRGFRTSNNAFAHWYAYHGATLVGKASWLRDSADDAGLFALFTKSTGGSLTSRLTISSTGAFTVAGAASLQSNLSVTGTSALTGVVGVGGSSSPTNGLRVLNTGLTGSDQYGIVGFPTFTSAATGSGNAIYAQVKTAAASFTMAQATGVWIDVASKGSGSTITTLYGLKVEDVTAGGTNLAIKTGLGRIEFGDAVSIGVAGITNAALTARINSLTGTTQVSFQTDSVFTSAATAKGIVVYAQLQTANSSFIMTDAYGVLIDQSNKGASCTITNLYGLYVQTQSQGGTNWAIYTNGSTGSRFGGAITAVGGIVFNGGGTNLNHYETGSFTGTLTGCTSSPTATINYVRIGNIVVLHFPASLSGTSNSTACTITGVPAAIRPTTAKSLFGNYNIQNGTGSSAGVGIAQGMQIDTGGTITLWTASSTIGFGSGSAKGVIGTNALGASGQFACTYGLS